MPAKKAAKKSANTSEEKDIKKEVQQVSSESESNNVSSGEEEVDWVQESNHSSNRHNESKERKPSVVDFSRDDTEALEKKKVSELSTEELLKVVIRRGEKEKNPVIFGGCGRLLKQINGERLAPRRGGNNSYRGGNNSYRGGNQGYQGYRGGSQGNQGYRGDNDYRSQGQGGGRPFEDDDDDDYASHNNTHHTRQDNRSGYRVNRGNQRNRGSRDSQGYQGRHRSNDRYQEEEANH